MGCGSSGSRTIASSSGEGSAEHPAIARSPAPEPACPEPVVVVDAGRERGTVCSGDAAARGLAIVDLQDAWTPRLFAPQRDGGGPSYRATYLALAAEQDAA